MSSNKGYDHDLTSIYWSIMKKKYDLIQALHSAGFEIYEANTEIDETSALHLKNLDELIQFAQKQGVNSLFYCYQYLDAESLIIDDDVTSKLGFDEDTLSVLGDRIEHYNYKVYGLDFTQPISLHVYCVCQGFVYFSYDLDYWFIEQGFDLPENIALQLANESAGEIEDLTKETETERAKKRERLRDQILNDPAFQKCTNSQLRRAYSDKLFSNNEEYSYLFFKKSNGMYSSYRETYDITPHLFIEEIWRDYKAKK
jgi:hypothetical protein